MGPRDGRHRQRVGSRIVTADPDAMWKPGYTGPSPSVASTARLAQPDGPDEPDLNPTSAPSTADVREELGASIERPNLETAPSMTAAGRARRRSVSTSDLLAGVVGVVAVSVTVVVGGVFDSELSGSASSASTPSRGFEAMEGRAPFITAELPSPLDVVAVSGQPFAGAEPGRIPSEVAELWRLRIDALSDSTDLPASMLAVVEVIDERFVVVISGSAAIGRNKSSVLSLVDAANGRVLWTVELDAGPETYDIIGVNGSALMVQTTLPGRSVIGLDLATGNERWSIIETMNRLDAIGSAAGYEVLRGTSLLARRPTVTKNPTVLFDPETGMEVGTLDGEVIGTDHLGTYYFAADGSVAVVDLSEGLSSIRLLEVPDEQPGDRLSVVDGNVVVVRDGQLLVEEPSVGFVVVVDRSDLPEPGTDESDRVRLPGVVAGVGPMLGSAMVVSSSGQMIGAELDGDEIRPAWRRDGIAGRTAQTERGTIILVSRRGGATQALVDGRTGETITLLTMTPGVIDNLEFAANGVLTRRTSADGSRLAAVDLDGREIWSLPGSDPVVLGEGIVVRVEISTEQAAVVAYGSPAEST